MKKVKNCSRHSHLIAERSWHKIWQKRTEILHKYTLRPDCAYCDEWMKWGETQQQPAVEPLPKMGGLITTTTFDVINTRGKIGPAGINNLATEVDCVVSWRQFSGHYRVMIPRYPLLGRKRWKIAVGHYQMRKVRMHILPELDWQMVTEHKKAYMSTVHALYRLYNVKCRDRLGTKRNPLKYSYLRA